MEAVTAQKKPHAVLVPFPSQGHITPHSQLARLLHARGFHITFVNTEYNHHRLILSKGPDSVKGLPDFQFATIPDGLPPLGRYDISQDLVDLNWTVRNNCMAPLLELLAKLNSTPGVPPVTCVISDGVATFAMEAAQQLGIADVVFWTASACGLMGYLQYSELPKRGMFPLKDESYLTNGYLETPLDWVPGRNGIGIRLKDLPTFNRTTNPKDVMVECLTVESHNTVKASGILINTLEEMEKDILTALADHYGARTYTVGPLKLMCQGLPESEVELVKSSSLWTENTECLDWLDTKEPSSVVYVNFGSIAVFSEQHMKEFAFGLANCGYPFLWILRSDSIMGKEAILPEGYLEETKGRGLITTWCPQEKVLAHPSLGAFLTHVGWNSTVESIVAGVPMLCWPVHGEQYMNTRYICDLWGNGLLVEHDVKREHVVNVVKEMMEGEKGKEVRKKALEWKKKAEEATSEGGSSYENFDRLINEVMLKNYVH